MDLCHSSAMGDHSGVTITKKRLDGILQLKGLWKDVRKFVRGSHMCQQNKYDSTACPRALQLLPRPHEIFTNITMDFIERFPKSQGKMVIMVGVDRLSKSAHFMSLSHLLNCQKCGSSFFKRYF